MIEYAAEPITTTMSRRHLPWWGRVVIGGGIGVILLVGGYELTYVNRIYPGVKVAGVSLGGLSDSASRAAVTARVQAFSKLSVPVAYNQTTVHVPISALQVSYNTNQSVSLAYAYGRTGGVITRLVDQWRALIGQRVATTSYTYNTAALTSYVGRVVDGVDTPVTNATLSYANGHVTVIPSTNGNRLDLGVLVNQIQDRLTAASTSVVPAPVYKLTPAISTSDLSQTATQSATYLAAPIQLFYDNQTTEISQATIASWINITQPPVRTFLDTLRLADLYPTPAGLTLGLNNAAVTAYVASFAANVDSTPRNATLAMVNGQLTVTSPSVDGVGVDQVSTVQAIMTALHSVGPRSLALKTTVVQADVRQDNLASLGINQLISEGETYFPGSSAARLINVRTGAAKFNGVLLSPGEEFSFGKLLGEVDASTGYVPGLVILGNHEADQYGGGLCQVSTTAFRAALLAGLPINERVNHAFAISFYTWPYGVPGVDATIYYPAVDMKFTNDTGSYILIQTTMSGSDLKFDFYGTKTKSGVIRGPQFVSGSNDATQPSHTVFYRDVLDLSGNVIKTDTFDTYYQPSTDYPVE